MTTAYIYYDDAAYIRMTEKKPTTFTDFAEVDADGHTRKLPTTFTERDQSFPQLAAILARKLG